MLSQTAKSQLARGELVEQAFDPRALPEGLDGVYRVVCEHPLATGARRVDEVPGAMLLAHRAEVEALGFRVVGEEPIGLQPARPLLFPRSAIPAFPKAVNDLLAIERALERERATAAEKPGRAEASLYEKVLPKVEAIDASLVPAFYDRLIDFYLEAGSEHYANRQAKEAVAAMAPAKGKGKDKGKQAGGASLDWLTRRCRQLIDKGFYSSLLAEAALDKSEQEGGPAAAFALALDLLDRLLTGALEPNEGLFAALKKRAGTAEARAEITAMLLRHTQNGMLLSASKKKEVKVLREAMLAAVDGLPAKERLATLEAMAEHARGTDGDLAKRAAMWHVLTERVKETPALEDSVIRLASKICKNIRIGDEIGDEHSDAGIDEGFRARVGQFLQKVSQEAFRRQYDFWANELDDYEDWARKWFFDTFLTMEELEEAHPELFKHPGIVRACTKGLLLGVKLAENKDEFLEKLTMFLELTDGKGASAPDMLSVVIGLFEEDRGPETKPLLAKLAVEAPDVLQEVLVGMAAEAARRPGQGLGLLGLLQECACWTRAGTRGRVREALAKAEAWRGFVELALDSAATLTPQEVWMDLAAIEKLSYRHDPYDIRIHDGARYFLAGDLGYGSILWVMRDGERIFTWPRNGKPSDDIKLKAIRFLEQDGKLKMQRVIDPNEYHGEKPWILATNDPDGGNQVEQELGAVEEAYFPRHAAWMVLVTPGKVEIRAADGATVLAEHGFTLEGRPQQLRSQLVLKGTESTFILGDDPAKPIIVPRVAEGFFFDGARLLGVCKSGKVAGEVITLGGASVARQTVLTGLRQCGQCEDWHERKWLPANLRGLPGDELLVREEYKYWQIEDAFGGRHGRVDTDMGPEQDEYTDVLVRDLDGDGFEEVYVFDHRRKRIGRVVDRAARARAAVAAARPALATLGKPDLSFLGSAPQALDGHLDSCIQKAPEAARKALQDPGFAPIRELLQAARKAIDALDRALKSEPERFPPKVRRERVKIPATELKRLHAAYFDSSEVRDYPLAQAVTAGSIEPYRKHWTRKEGGHEDMGYMRRVLAIHMDIARETDLAPVLRGRVLDLASQILDTCLAPTNWIGLTEHWGTEKEIKGEKKIQKAVADRSIEPVADQLANLADKWDFGPMEWPIDPEEDDDLLIHGTAHVGEVTVIVPIRLYGRCGLVATIWDPPYMLGPWQEVAALQPRLQKLTGTKAYAPKEIWPKGKPAWAPLPDWFTPEEIESTRREIERLRALPPGETTTGRGANAGVIVELAGRFEVKDDTAAVLAACVAGPLEADKDKLAAWAGVKRDSVQDHLKKLEKAGAAVKVEKELRLKVAYEGLEYEHSSSQVPVFKRLFWNRHWNNDSDVRKYRTKTARRFLEEDILREYLRQV
jgi:hypothetical protein